MSGLRLKNSFATLANVTIQPTVSQTNVKIVGKPVLPEKLFTTVVSNPKTKFLFGKFDYRIVRDGLSLNIDHRYNDELPRSTAKFTPFEELSGIASFRPEILSVTEFKPVITDDGAALTPAGEFLDAQVKLMNLRHEAMVTLIKDLKTDPELAEQLDQVEGDFLKHVQNLKERVEFLAVLQKYTDNINKLLDLRDANSNADVASVLGNYFASAFTNLGAAQTSLPACTFVDLLGQHGFTKNNVSAFSNTKVFLQILYESRKSLRAGSDEFIGVDRSIAAKDVDPVTLNKRSYSDPHLGMGRVNMASYDAVRARAIHESDAHLNTLVRELETQFRSIDKVFAGTPSEEVSYALKLKTLTREVVYSQALANASTSALMLDYGYPISADVGNQQLFDAVYGQLGERITDDRSNSNANSVASVASRVDGDKAALTFEVDYLEDVQGSVFTPGSSYYVTSALRPNDSNAFSIERASALVTRLTSVIDRYTNFIGRFNILPRVGNVALGQMANTTFVAEPITMANALYALFVDNSSGYVLNDVAGNPIIDLFGEAASNAALRANLLVYVSCVTNASNDGLVNAEELRALADQDIRFEAQKRANDAEDRNARVSPTIDKVVNAIVSLYKQATNDVANASKLEYALRHFNEKGPLSRSLAYIKSVADAHKAVMNGGFTRYSRVSDSQMVALTLQTVLDTTRRYVYNRTRENKGVYVNSNYKSAARFAQNTNSSQAASPQLVKNSLSKSKSAVAAYTVPAVSNALGVSYLVSKLPLKQAILARLEREEILTVRTALAPLYAMRSVCDNLREFVFYLQKSENVAVLNAILEVVGDRKLVELLADKGQVRLLYDTVQCALQKVNPSAGDAVNTDITDVVSLTRSGSPDDDLRVFDDSFITSKTANLMKAAFSDARYRPARGSNVRVVAFGLPHGFTANLTTKFKISTFVEQAKSKRKQNDVVIADVYKVDVRHPDLIFKPQSRVLELSRFVSRDEKKYGDAQVGVSLSSVIDAIPTIDYSEIVNPIVSSSRSNIPLNDYDFMSSNDVDDMLQNTVMSYLLELYFRTLTGIPLSERELYIQDPDESDRPAPFIVKSILKKASEDLLNQSRPDFFLQFSAVSKSKTVPYSSLSKTSKSSSTFHTIGKDKNISQVVLTDYNKKAVNQASAVAAVAGHAAKKKTVYTDRELASKYLLSPKLFERVFFVDVDPDDFEIDRDETFKNDVGKEIFSQLQQAGEIETVSETISQMTRDSFYLKEHRLENQMAFEKYFVVVRSYAPLTTKRTR